MMLEKSFSPPKGLKGEKKRAWLATQAKIERGIFEGLLTGTMQQNRNGLFSITEKGRKLNENKRQFERLMEWRDAA